MAISKKKGRKNVRFSLGAHMQRRGRAFFTGRGDEVQVFRETCQVLRTRVEDIQIKRVFNVYGQGGTGKTTLLAEFERICDEERVPYSTLTRSAKAEKLSSI